MKTIVNVYADEATAVDMTFNVSILNLLFLEPVFMNGKIIKYVEHVRYLDAYFCAFKCVKLS